MKINAKILIKIRNINAIPRYHRKHVKVTLLDYVFLMVNVKFLTIKSMSVRIIMNLHVGNQNRNVCLRMELVN